MGLAVHLFSVPVEFWWCIAAYLAIRSVKHQFSLFDQSLVVRQKKKQFTRYSIQKTIAEHFGDMTTYEQTNNLVKQRPSS